MQVATPHEGGKPEPRWRLVLPPLVAFLAGLAFLSSKSFTSDEAVSVTLARLSWRHFGDLVVHRETNGSLYFTLLHLLTHGSGGEWGARLLSLAAFVCATAVFVLLVRRLFGARTASIAGVLFALSPLHVEYGQTAREYLLALLLVVSSTYLFVRGVQEPSPAIWIGYAACSAAGAYAFLLAAAVPVAHALSLAALPRARVPWRLVGLAAAVLVVLVLPLVVALTQTRASGGVAWAAGNLPGRVAVSVRDKFPRAVLAALLAALTAGLAYVWWRIAPRFRWAEVLMFAWLAVPVYLVSVAALLWQPLFIVRYFLVFAPPLLVLVAAALLRLRGPAFAAAALVVLLVLGFGLARWYRSDGADYRSASAYVAGAAHPGDGVLFYAPYVRLPFELYFQSTSLARADMVRPVYPADSWARARSRFIEAVEMPAGPIRRAVAGYRRVWLVLSQYRLYGKSDPGYDHVLSALSSGGFRLVQNRSFAGVSLRRYDR